MSSLPPDRLESRREKLELAKKKLKRYRERQASNENIRRSHSRADKENGYRHEKLARGYSTDSLAESTTSDVRFSSSKSQPGDVCTPSQFSRPPSAAGSLPAGPSNLYHDELRSPFQRVRGTSESSTDNNTTPVSNLGSGAASPAQQYSGSLIQPRPGPLLAQQQTLTSTQNYFYPSSTNSGSSTPANPLASYFGQAPTGSSFVSQATVQNTFSAMNPSPQNVATDASTARPMNPFQTGNVQEISSASNTVPASSHHQKDPDPSPLESFSVEPSAAEPKNLLIPNYNSPETKSENYDGTTVGKISITKSSVIEEDGDSGENTPVIGADYSGYNSAVVDSSPEKSSAKAMEFQSRINQLLVENESLKKNYTEQHQNYQQTVQQLQQLHSHYTQLHAAYSSLAEQQTRLQAGTGGDKGSGNGDREAELQAQVQQHLQTMSVLVEEKTELQSSLRQAMEIANQKHVENEELQGRLKTNREKIATLEKEMNSEGSVKTLLEKTLQKQKSELEKCRTESAQFEAKVIGMQQDRSETLARLKVKAREVDRLQAELGDLRKEVQENKAQLEVWKKEASQSKENYEVYGRQLNQKIFQISAQVEKLSEEKLELEGKLQNMQDIQQEASTASSSQSPVQPNSSNEGSPDRDIQSARDHVETMELKQKLDLVVERCRLLDQELQSAHQAIIMRDEELARAKGVLTAKETEVERIKEEVDEKIQCSTDTKELLQQLQNEKTTVSRAVAQNLDLKNQLGELQDKFVHLTEQNMELTDRLQTMEHTIQQLNEQKSEEDKDLTEKTAEVESLQERLNLVMNESLQKSRIEAELTAKDEEDGNLREHLEAAQKRIKFLNETNIQLEERVALLTAESRDSVADVVAEHRETQLRELEAKVQHLETEAGEAAALREEMVELRRVLAETRANSQRYANENSELHHIMAQNAADENQNTIHVELQQALNRITTLSTENERLRQMADNLERTAEEAFPRVSRPDNQGNNFHENQGRSYISTPSSSSPSTSSSNGNTPVSASVPQDARRRSSTNEENMNISGTDPDVLMNGQRNLDVSRSSRDDASVCSDHRNQQTDEGLENLKQAMEQLQSRFTKAMQENADLVDQNQQMEHLVTQLQNETDTVATLRNQMTRLLNRSVSGEYITIYQHQRKVIRQRLKEREESVAKLSREKEEVQNKLEQLQSLVMELLDEKGALHVYAQFPPTREKPKHSPPLHAGQKRPKNLSLSEADEVTGTEEYLSTVVPHQNGNPPQGIELAKDASDVDAQSVHSGCSHGSSSSRRRNRDASDTGPAEQILRILTELKRPDLKDSLGPSDFKNLHCKYCTGRMMTI